VGRRRQNFQGGEPMGGRGDVAPSTRGKGKTEKKLLLKVKKKERGKGGPTYRV